MWLKKHKKVPTKFSVLYQVQKTFSPGGPKIHHPDGEKILIFQKNVFFRNICKFRYVPETALILILSLENVSLGPLETFWSQGCMSLKCIIREEEKKFEKLTIDAKIHHFSDPPKKRRTFPPQSRNCKL